MENVRRRCPRCREEVEVERGARQAICPRCSALFDVLVLASKNAPSQPGHPMDESARPLYPFALAVVGLTVLAIVAAVALVFVNRATSRRETERFRKRQTHIAELIPRELPAPASQVWFEPEAPATFTLSKGSEAFVGLVMRAPGRAAQLQLVAFDEAMKPLWQDGPLGLTQEGALTFHVASDGASVVVTDARPTVRVYEAQRGTPRFAVPVPQVVQRVCAGPGGKFELVGREGDRFVLDVEKQHLTPGTLGACPAAPSPGGACSAVEAKVRLHAQCVEPSTLPMLEGVTWAWGLRAAEVTVGLGRDSTRGGLTVAAFRGKALLWQQPLPLDASATGPHFPLLADVGAGLLVIKVPARAAPFHSHLLAFELATGRLRFDRELPREEHAINPAMTLTPSRLYVPTAGALEIVDAASGAVVGTVGE